MAQVCVLQTTRYACSSQTLLLLVLFNVYFGLLIDLYRLYLFICRKTSSLYSSMTIGKNLCSISLVGYITYSLSLISLPSELLLSLSFIITIFLLYLILQFQKQYIVLYFFLLYFFSYIKLFYYTLANQLICRLPCTDKVLQYFIKILYIYLADQALAVKTRTVKKNILYSLSSLSILAVRKNIQNKY